MLKCKIIFGDRLDDNQIRVDEIRDPSIFLAKFAEFSEIPCHDLDLFGCPDPVHLRNKRRFFEVAYRSGRDRRTGMDGGCVDLHASHPAYSWVDARKDAHRFNRRNLDADRISEGSDSLEQG